MRRSQWIYRAMSNKWKRYKQSQSKSKPLWKCFYKNRKRIKRWVEESLGHKCTAMTSKSLQGNAFAKNRAHLSTFVSIFYGYESTQVNTIPCVGLFSLLERFAMCTRLDAPTMAQRLLARCRQWRDRSTLPVDNHWSESLLLCLKSLVNCFVELSTHWTINYDYFHDWFIINKPFQCTAEDQKRVRRRLQQLLTQLESTQS